MKAFKVQTVYHAAAYKHVPLVEFNLVEGVRNNVFGTWHTAEAAIAAGVEQFVLISTDKAVRPLFKRQIAEGGPVTVTHPEITRYLMIIPEAAQLVIQAGTMGTSGSVFVLDMGEPVKIVDLARKMIHLSGLEVRDSSNPLGGYLD